MARLRALHQCFWTDDKVIALNNNEVLLFIGLITHADDEGIIEKNYQSLYFKLARAEMTIEKLKEAYNTLENNGMIASYGRYSFIPSWFRWQTVSHPAATKLKRPPRELIAKYPEYVSKWEYTFRVKGVTVKYPFDTCSTDEEIKTPEQHKCTCKSCDDCQYKIKVEKQEVKEETPQPQQPIELKLVNLPAKQKEKHSPEDTQLCNEIKDIFQKAYGMNFPNYKIEIPAIYRIIKLTRNITDLPIIDFVKNVIVSFKDLQEAEKRSNSRKTFWIGQPCLPSVISCDGLWSRIIENLKNVHARLEQEKEYESLIHIETEEERASREERERIEYKEKRIKALSRLSPETRDACMKREGLI